VTAVEGQAKARQWYSPGSGAAMDEGRGKVTILLDPTDDAAVTAAALAAHDPGHG
jgi:hypothetical protein